MSRKRIAVLGSTGSIGRQTLEVAEAFPDRLQVVALAAHRSVDAMAAQIRQSRPRIAVLRDETAADRLRGSVGEMCAVEGGERALEELATGPEVDIVVAALSGIAGLRPVLAALAAGKTVALANKEPLVAAGGLVIAEAERGRGCIIPVDSEHSAIFQALGGRGAAGVHRLLITASGGPFADTPVERMWEVTPEQALAHPTWQMGPKVTIDSATLMNKGLEVIEAHWLFSIRPQQIEIVIHPQSMIHSMVEFVDGSVIAQAAPPDMRLPIQYALSHPERWASSWGRFSPAEVGALTFGRPDLERFPCLRLAYSAAETGGTMPAVMNAADEVAVARFLAGEIRLPEIARIIEEAMAGHTPVAAPTLSDVEAADAEVRERLSAGPLRKSHRARMAP